LGYSASVFRGFRLGTEVKWKEDKDLTKEFEIKKQQNNNTNRTHLVRKARPTESFFNFFNPPESPSEEAIENGDIEPNELEGIEEKLEVDYHTRKDLKGKSTISLAKPSNRKP